MPDDLDPVTAVERVVGQMRLWLLGLGSLTLAQVDDLAPKMARAALVAAGPLVSAEHDAQVAAQALREAAALRRGPDQYGVESVPAQWIEEMADRIERQEETR